MIATQIVPQLIQSQGVAQTFLISHALLTLEQLSGLIGLLEIQCVIVSMDNSTAHHPAGLT